MSAPTEVMSGKLCFNLAGDPFAPCKRLVSQSWLAISNDKPKNLTCQIRKHSAKGS